MSGILIEVDSNTANAQKGLAEINAQLSALVRNTQVSNKLLGGLSAGNLREIGNNAKTTSTLLQKLGSVGSAAFNGIVTPIKSVVSGLTSLPFLIGSLVTTVVAIKGVNAFYSMADQLTVIQNKLRLVTKDTQELNTVQTQLYLLSKQTYTTQSGAADVYFNLARAMKTVGTSSKDLLDYTKTIQQTVSVSGISAQSAAAALLQLNQGISSGTLRGDELNSVMEQLPRLGIALTQSLGMSAGKLRDFAAEGKLTTEILLGVLRDQASAIDAEFNSAIKTAAQGMERFQESISNLVQTINGITHSSSNFARVMTVIANGFDAVARNIVPQLYIIEQGVRNYIDNIDMLSASVLVLRDLNAAKISIFDVYSLYKEYDNIKSIIAKYKEQLGLARKEGAKSIFAQAQDKFSIPSFSNPFKAIKAPTPPTDWLEVLKDGFRVIVAIGNAIGGLTSKFGWLIPDIRIPLRTFSNDVDKFFRQLQVDIYAWSITTFKPMERAVEGVYQYFTLFTQGDNQLERAFVNVAHSGSIKEFIKNLNDLGDAGRAMRFTNVGVFVNDVHTTARAINEDALAVLRYFGIINNRLLFINNIRFDRAADGLKTFVSIVKRVYDDVIFPKIAPSVAGVYLYVKGMLEALASALKDNFTFNTGISIGESLMAGAVSVFKSIGVSIKDVMKGTVFKLAVDDNSVLSKLTLLARKVRDILLQIAAWLSGVIVGIFTGAAKEIEKAIYSPFEIAMRRAKTLVTDMFTKSSISDKIATEVMSGIFNRGVKYKFTLDPTMFQEAMRIFDRLLFKLVLSTYDTMVLVERRIRQFGGVVKEVFYDIYDKVVGHSYWPDMIDGVNEYTGKVFKSDSLLTKFKDKVVNTFKSIADTIRSSSSSFGDIFKGIKIKLEGIEWGSVGGNLRQVLSAALVAALLYAFGGSTAKIIAVDFILSTIGDEFLTLVGAMPKAITAAFGESVGFITATISTSFIKALNGVIAALPSFAQSFLSGLGPIGKGIASLLNFGPNNGLMYALIFGTGAYALKAKGGLKAIKELIVGAESKKGKPAVPGLVDYLPRLFFDAPASGNGKLFEQILGKNPKLLTAGIAVVSTAFMDSISLLESSIVGVPMIMMALFGKDTGGSMIRKIIFTEIPKLGGIMARALSNVLAQYKFTGWISSLIDGLFLASDMAAASFDRIRVAPRGPIMASVATLGSDLMDILKNVQKNAADYIAGNMSFVEMFLRNGKIGNVTSNVQIKQSMSQVFKEIGNFKLFGISLVTAKDFAVDLYTKVVGATRTVFSKGGLVSNMFVSTIEFAKKISDNVKQIVLPIGAAIASMFTTMSAGAKAFFAIIFSRVGVFIALALGLVGAATAATGFVGGLAEMGTQLKTIIIIGASVAATMYAIGKAVEAIGDFKAAKLAFANMAAEAVMNLQQTKDIGKNAFKASILKTGPGKGSLDAARAAEIAALDAIRAKAFTTAADSTGAWKAGIDALKASLTQTVTSVYNFFKTIVIGAMGASKWLWTLASNTILQPYFWYKVSYAIGFATMSIMNFGGIALKTIRLVGLAIAGLTTAIVGLGAIGIWKTVIGAWEALAFSVKQFGVAYTLIANGFGWIVRLASWIRTIGVAVLAVKATLVVGVITGIGALGLWLFGPGDTLLESLEYVKDKITGIFGGTATGQLTRITDMKEALKDTNIGDLKISFKTDVEKLDLAKLSKEDYEIVLKSAETTKETIEKMRSFYVLQGQLTAEQLDEWKKAEATQKKILSVQPVKEPVTMQSASDELIAQLTVTDDSFLARTERMLKVGFSSIDNAFFGSMGIVGGLVVTPIKGAIHSFGEFVDDFSDSVSLFIDHPIDFFFKSRKQLADQDNKKILAPTTLGSTTLHNLGVRGMEQSSLYLSLKGLQDSVKDTINEIKFASSQKLTTSQIAKASVSANLIKDATRFSGKLTEEERSSYNNAAKNYGSADERLTRFNEKNDNRRFTPIGDKNYEPTFRGYLKQKADLEKSATFTRGVFESIAVYSAELGRRRTEVDEYTKSMTALGVKTKEFFDISLGQDSRDWLGVASQTAELDSLTDLYDIALKDLRVWGRNAEDALKFKIDMSNFKRKSKELEDEVKAMAFLGTGFEYQIKVTGVDTTKEALASLYAYNKEGYDTWKAAYEEAKAAKQEFDSLSLNNGTQENVAKALERMLKAQDRAKQAAPKKTFFTDISDQVQQLGLASSLSMRQFSSISKESAISLLSQLNNASEAKRKLEQVTTTKRPFEEQILALRKMLKLTKDLDQRLVRETVEANKRVQKNPDLDFSQKVQSQAELFGREVPDSVGKNSKRLAEWRARDERIGMLELDISGKAGKTLTPFEYTQKRTQLDREKKAQAKFEDVLPDMTTATMLTNLSDIGANFSLKEVLSLPSGVLKDLKTAANTLAQDEFNMNKYDYSENAAALKKMANNKIKALKLGSDAYLRYSFKSASGIMQELSDTGFTNVSYKKILNKQGDNEHKKLVQDAAANKKLLEDANLAPIERELAIKAKIDIDARVRKMDFTDAGFEDELKRINDLFPDLSLTTKEFGTMLPTMRQNLEVAAMETLRLNNELAELGSSAEDAARSIEIEIERRKAAERARLAAVSGNFVKRGMTGIDKTNKLFSEIDIPYANVGDAADRIIRNAQDKLDTEMQNYKDTQVGMSTAQRQAAIEIIQEKKEKLDAAILLATLKRSDTQAYKAGQQLASDTKTAVSDGIKSFLTGKSTFKETIGTFAKTFAEKILGSYVDGMMSAAFKPKGAVDKMLTSLGEVIFGTGAKNFFADLFGGNDEKDFQLVATKELTNAIKELITTISGGRRNVGADNLKSTFDTPLYNSDGSVTATNTASNNIADSFVKTDLSDVSKYSRYTVDGLSDNTNITKIGFTDTVSGLANVGNAVKGLMGVGGNGISGSDPLGMFNTFAGAINSVNTITKFFKFAEGGSVAGPGTGTSDSIPAMLSDGEFVVKASSAKRYRNLLEGLNSGNIAKFASGGLVGMGTFNSDMPAVNSLNAIKMDNSRSSSSQQVFNINITGDVSRQTRAEIQRMIPQIATGVNMTNREQGNRK